MSTFETPTELMNNRGLIADPETFAREKGAASWLYLCGEEFASMEGGMSYEDVQRAVPVSANVVSDPPTPLDLDLARTGPRSSALIYLYAGLQASASADDVLARAEADDAAWTKSDELRAWVADGLDQLS
jgi:hypothetical protein